MGISGDDLNACNESTSPCATIPGVFANPGFTTGDTVNISAGVYTIEYGGNYAGVLIEQSASISGGWDSSFLSKQGTTYLESIYTGITVVSNATVFLFDLVINGGGDVAIHNSGEIHMENVTASSVNDSAILNYGSITIINSRITQSGGCGIMNSGSIQMTGTDLDGNYGCGITNDGTMQIDHSIIRGSVLRWGCTGISNSGNLRLENSAVVNNGSYYPNPGAGMCNFGQSVIINSTISGNNAVDQPGGGINNEGDLSLFNTTINHNHASAGGGVYIQSGQVIIQNSLVAQNSSSSGSVDCFGEIHSLGYNLIGDPGGCVLLDQKDDILGVHAIVFPASGSPIPSAPLARYSPAIDSGDPVGCYDDTGQLLDADQRGVERVGRCDIGAYEYDSSVDPLRYI